MTNFLENIKVTLYTSIYLLIGGLQIFFKGVAVLLVAWVVYYGWVQATGSWWDKFKIDFIPW